MKEAGLFIKLARPHFLVGAALLYALGVGIAHYLGATIDWGDYVMGQAWVTMVQLSTHFLNEYFDATADAENPNRTPFSGGSGVLGPGKLPRPTALWAGIICLAAAASIAVFMLLSGPVSPASILVMLLIFVGAFFYAVPPVQLASSGYGELTTSVLVANLVPALGLLLQTGEMHRLLPMATFPLTALHMAMLLAFELPDYGTDLKHQKNTLMVRAGWQLGMNLHNFLILVAYVLFGVAMLWGMPAVLALPALFVFPLGLLQIWMMQRIGGGAKPNWSLLTLGAVALFALTAYLLAFAFWTH